MPQTDYYGSERKDLAELIPADVKRILEVGCGSGGLARVLKRAGFPEVVGIEKHEEAARQAEDFLDRVIVGDAEEITPDYPDGYFDCIIYGDLLEHLREPANLLARYRRYLAEGGLSIASIPNISHYRIVKNLILDKWDYEDSGIMDRAHLRFFTLKSITELFGGTGYRIEEVKRHIRCKRFVRALDFLTGKKMTHLVTEQYLVKARKG